MTNRNNCLYMYMCMYVFASRWLLNACAKLIHIRVRDCTHQRLVLGEHEHSSSKKKYWALRMSHEEQNDSFL
jgi:hypothetical protein